MQAANAFAAITLASINSTDPDHPTLHPAPYTGVTYPEIPQYESLGLTVGQQLAKAIAGTESVSQALQAGQSAASQYTPAQLAGG
jgi:sorbitol/mannitol transport system substrate-binding protein